MKLLQEELNIKGIDCAIFATYEKVNPNLFYLIGYSGAGFLVVTANGEFILHVPSRDLFEAKQINGVEVSSGKKLAEMIKERGISTKKVGIDFSNISVSDFNSLKERLGCEFTDLTEFMNKVRIVKGKDEIDLIRRACFITDLILAKFVKNFKKFKTEKEAVAFLVYESTKMAEGVSFEPIVASGKNAAVPHHKPIDVMNKGFCVVDFGVKYIVDEHFNRFG